jgi:poly(A) polymerase
VAPSFMLACMLWHDVQNGWTKLKDAGEPSFPALQQAIDAVFDARIGDISGRGKLAADMREIWMMQPRFERRVGNAVLTLVEQPRFRAGFDFLRLRGDAGEIDADLATWWEDFSLADEAGREHLMDEARTRDSGRRASGGGGRGDAGGAHPPVEPSADPARKRRRRRRKPAGAGEGGDGGTGGVSAPDA